MIVRSLMAVGLIASGLSISVALPASAQMCGHYVVLGCFKNANQAFERLNWLGGPMAGGGAGSKVVDTNQFPNFRNGWFCAVDGPYASRSQALSIAWNEAVPDAYVKNGC